MQQSIVQHQLVQHQKEQHQNSPKLTVQHETVLQYYSTTLNGATVNSVTIR